ncbi:hypothetical protein NA57DRAFT_72727 [Rhizodiscina lignyota]|uniref:Uncharacterized protein n=1 Tax=Rhizodiscina lignyota TaxID=1504668 RepID=A0A9P4IGR7_9PEZI|nr:hypothetical protein NA57DRAFT_72727 [Rhizodiscina lignyota]
MSTYDNSTLYTTVEHRNIIDRPTRLGSILVRGRVNDVGSLIAYINANYHAQYTPSDGLLCGLYALEIALKPICTSIGRIAPNFMDLLNLYRSQEYKNNAYQLSLSSSANADGEIDFVVATEQYTALTQEISLGVQALILLLELVERSIIAAFSLGVITWEESTPDGHKVYRAYVHDRVLANQVDLSRPHFVVWLFNTSQPDSRDGILNHWEGLAPQPMYNDPMLNAQGCAAPRFNHLPRLNTRNQTFTLDQSSNYDDEASSPEKSPKSLSSRSTPSPVDPVPRRESYPRHLDVDDLIANYPGEIHGENLLYCLLYYKQAELREKLKVAGVYIHDFTLRQRKRSALEKRCQRRNLPVTPENMAPIIAEYDRELEEHGMSPRKHRNENERRNSRSPSIDDYTSYPSLPDLQSKPMRTAAPPLRPAPGTINPDDMYHSRTQRSILGDLWPPLKMLKLDTDFSARHTHAQEQAAHIRANHSARVERPAWLWDGWEPAANYAHGSLSAGTVPRTLAEYLARPLPQGRADFSNVSDAKLTAMLQAELDKHPDESEGTLVPSADQSPNFMSAEESMDWFLQANRPRIPGQPGSKGPGVGPPGPPIPYVWPEHDPPPNLTVEQIAYYERVSHLTRIPEHMMRYIRSAKKRKYDEMMAEYQTVIEIDDEQEDHMMMVDHQQPEENDDDSKD